MTTDKKWIAFNEPFWTDKEPYCNTIRCITTEDAAAFIRRRHEEQYGVQYPGTEQDAVLDFAAVTWAWRCEEPKPGE